MIMKEKILKRMAKEAQEAGDTNLAIVLHVYLGSKIIKHDGLFAEHCQDFARSSLDWFETEKRINEIKNN